MTAVLPAALSTGLSAGLAAGLSRVAPPTLQTIPDAVTANVATIREVTGARIMAVVKADGYAMAPSRWPARRSTRVRAGWV